MTWSERIAKTLEKLPKNVASAVNVAEGRGAVTSVRRKQRIVQRDGETVVTTTTEETSSGEERDHGHRA